MGKIIRVTPEQWLTKGETAVQQRRSKLVLWGGIVGEEADFKVVHQGKNQVRAVLENVPTPSPDRVEIPCAQYDPCGGCPMMHVSPEGQRRAHEIRVRHALDQAGLRDVDIDGWTPSPKQEDFRHVVKLGWGWTQDRTRIKIGAFGRLDRRIIPIPKCVVAAPIVRSVMTSLAHHALQLGIEPYEPEPDRGVLRAAVIRASRTTGEVLVTLIAGRRPKQLDELVERLGHENQAVVGIWLHRNTELGNALFSPEEDGTIRMKHLAGRGYIEEALGDDLTVRVGPGDFYQTNPALALPLYERALDRLKLGREHAFLDLYSGVGGLTLLGARRAGLAIGVEQVQGAVSNARETARRHNIDAEFIAGDVIEVLPKLNKRIKHPYIAVDPARRGLHPEVTDAIIAMQPSRMVYISCNPVSLARDLVRLREAGATLEHVELFDMFPNTAHVECITALSFPVEAGRAPRRRRIPRKR